MIWLLIDDIRNLGCDVTVRTATAGKRALLSYVGDIECLCLDHDLGPDQESGYDIAKWAFEYDVMPKWVQIVTSNPVGRQNIANLLMDHGYKSSDGINYRLTS